MLKLAVGFYTGMLIVACLLTGMWGDWSTWFPVRSIRGYALDVGIGCSIGLGIVLLSQWLMPRLRWGQTVTREFASLLAGTTVGEAFILALASGLAEEAFFRATLQPWIGWVLCSLLFGLLHIKMQKEFIVWTVFAVAFGFLMGGIVEYRPGLLLPTVTHVTINFMNINWIVRHGRKV